MYDPSETFTAQDWDEVRTAFASSIMVDVPLRSLAQNLEGPSWPIPGRKESPSAYIDLAFVEMNEFLALKGYPDRANLLISILKDTLAFDNPFGDMVNLADQNTERDNPDA